MTNLASRTRRWPKIALAVIVLVELALGIGIASLQAADSSTPLALDDEVWRFREQQRAASNAAATSSTIEPSAVADPKATASQHTTTTTAAVASAAQDPDPSTPGTTSAPETGLTRPAAGVYTYDTTGWEEVDVLGGARHEYPAETRITIVDEGDGQRVRWTALEERWDEWTTNFTTAGEEWTTLATHREFFGQSDERTFECQPGAVYVPTDQSPGTAFEMHCGDEDLSSVCEGEVIGTESLEVGGTTIETLRLRMDTTMEGDVRGHMGRDYWVDPSTGLLVRMVLETDTESDGPMGTMHYEEEVELMLKTLTPQQ